MNHSAAIDSSAAPMAGITRRRFAMWLFLASEVMFFTGLIGAYIVLRAGSVSWPDPTQELNIPLTAFNTFVLICSSVTMVRALYAIRHDGSITGLRNNLLATVIFGTFFLGVQAYEWRELYAHGLTPEGSMFGATFYTLTGFHGLHVLGGVVALLYLLIGASRGRYTLADHEGVELVGLYWHFVDLVWILLFTIVYLI